MYKIKRHLTLNLYYLHDLHSGPVTANYEIVEEDVGQFQEAITKLKEYQKNCTPNIDGLFEDYYRYEHMKGLWGDPLKVQPAIGRLFYTCTKETFISKRTIFELYEVKSIQEPHITVFNHSSYKNEQMTFGQFQGLALIPEREESFIQNWESKTCIRYPRNLISKLVGCNSYRQIRNKTVSLAQHICDWDLPKIEMNTRKSVIGA